MRRPQPAPARREPASRVGTRPRASRRCPAAPVIELTPHRRCAAPALVVIIVIIIITRQLLRGAGCTVNDLWDRDIDKQVRGVVSDTVVSDTVVG